MKLDNLLAKRTSVIATYSPDRLVQSKKIWLQEW